MAGERTCGEPPSVFGRSTVRESCHDLSPARHVAEEVRRARSSCRVVGMDRAPIDSEEMKASCRAALMTAGTCDVVEPALESVWRTDVDKSSLGNGFGDD